MNAQKGCDVNPMSMIDNLTFKHWNENTSFHHFRFCKFYHKEMLKCILYPKIKFSDYACDNPCSECNDFQPNGYIIFQQKKKRFCDTYSPGFSFFDNPHEFMTCLNCTCEKPCKLNPLNYYSCFELAQKWINTRNYLPLQKFHCKHWRNKNYEILVNLPLNNSWICPECKKKVESKKQDVRIHTGRNYQHFHYDCYRILYSRIQDLFLIL